MKKTGRKKLTLNVQTIRQLNNTDMVKVGGGMAPQNSVGPDCFTRAPPCGCAPSDSVPC